MAYTKYKDTWQTTDLLSGKAFNHLETQWDELKFDADAHNHDTRYYLNTLADTTLFSTSFFTGFDADKLDGLHYADVVSASLPLGSVLIWSGSAGTIPAHWCLCDGGESGGITTPDLRDRFVVGAGSTYNPDATGGPATYAADLVPTATMAVGAHVLTTAELPVHTHPYTQNCPSNIANHYGSAYPSFTAGVSVSAAIGNQVLGDGSHGHPGSTIAFDPVASRPPYYALCYILKYE